jgi:flagellar basal body-associated protein FliL
MPSHSEHDSEKEYDPKAQGEDDAFDFSDETQDTEQSPRRRRKRIKVRKRVRIKRKSNPKKKFRKILEIIAWTVIIIAFIVTLVVLVTELDLNEKNRKKRTQGLQPDPALELTEINPNPLTNLNHICC